ncbi:MAG: S8 family serine peptidase [Actinomycetota bacterium]|nr:S8 family serine peptidase [Actinomycetota bacterium]
MSTPRFGARKNLPGHVAGQVVVRVHPDAVRPHLPAAAIAAGPAQRMRGARMLARHVPDEVMAPLEHLRRNAGLEDVRPLFEEPATGARRAKSGLSPADRTRHAIAASVIESDDDEISGLAVATVKGGKVTKRILDDLNSASTIEFAEPVAARWLLARRSDPKRNVQWGLPAIRFFDAKRPRSGALSIGVMDTGLDTGHPDFDTDAIDYDHQGAGKGDPAGHGTHVAGIVGAVPNNDIGITGLVRSRLSVWKIFRDEPTPEGDFLVDTELFQRALKAAEGKGLHALNLSIGGTERQRVEELLVRRLIRRGVTVCAAMGNEYETWGDPTEYPAAVEGVISVGAIGEDRRRASFSNTGKHIDLVAPGVNILSTVPVRRSKWRPETEYTCWDGTSMATPHVTVAAAMVARANPSFGPDDVRDHLRKKAMRLRPMGRRKWTREYGSGLLDLAAALS